MDWGSLYIHSLLPCILTRVPSLNPQACCFSGEMHRKEMNLKKTSGVLHVETIFTWICIIQESCHIELFKCMEPGSRTLLPLPLVCLWFAKVLVRTLFLDWMLVRCQLNLPYGYQVQDWKQQKVSLLPI